jgi:NAD(P)-dependent dehydrogenase (short-subunit alcohol dehydrogenase family)
MSSNIAKSAKHFTLVAVACSESKNTRRKIRMKHVIVTGASTGIGYAAAEAFIQKGYHVYGNVRKQADADRLQQALGERFTPLIFDVTDHAAIQAAAQKVQAEVGNQGIACLVNNAGVATSGPLMLQSLDEFRFQFEVNVVGVLAVTQAFLPLLGARKNPGHAPGRILMISSVGGKVSGPFLGAYSGSKHALEGMSASLRRELMLYGIDVIVIGPGSVVTPIWDKPSANEIGPFAGSDFEPMIRKFQNFFVTNGRKGLPAEYLGKRIVAIAEKAKPRTRYTIVPNYFTNWFMPRVLPARVMDRYIGKATGLLQK